MRSSVSQLGQRSCLRLPLRCRGCAIRHNSAGLTPVEGYPLVYLTQGGFGWCCEAKARSGPHQDQQPRLYKALPLATPGSPSLESVLFLWIRRICFRLLLLGGQGGGRRAVEKVGQFSRLAGLLTDHRSAHAGPSAGTPRKESESGSTAAWVLECTAARKSNQATKIKNLDCLQ